MKYFPFDSHNTAEDGEPPVYDRAADSEDLAKWMSAYFTNGVFPTGYNSNNEPTGLGFDVTATSGLGIRVAPGMCNINGRFGYDTANTDLTLDAADTTNPRIDTVVLILDLSDSGRNISIGIHKGDAAASPTAKQLERTSSIYMMALAEIRVAANATSITNANINKNVRTVASKCGVVQVPLNTPDMAGINSDLRAKFDEWFENVRDQLSEDAAGHLQNEIDDLSGDLEELSGQFEFDIAQRIHLKKLWVNADPATQKSWEAQTTTLNLTSYDGVYVEYLEMAPTSTAATNNGRHLFAYGKKGIACALPIIWINNNGGHRGFTPTDSGITWELCNYNDNSSSRRKDTCVPLTVYGVKGVVESI